MATNKNHFERSNIKREKLLLTLEQRENPLSTQAAIWGVYYSEIANLIWRDLFRCFFSLYKFNDKKIEM